ncbi:hypothetical protein F4801DRAFT_602303 [Xylaria longipes]|nr:hypothetical protein F4801DRAFT_602303 [Xylaria longipes]
MSENTRDHKNHDNRENHEDDGRAPVRPSIPPADLTALTEMSLEQRLDAFRRGEFPEITSQFRVLEPDAVKVPIINRHPVGMINKRERLRGDNIVLEPEAVKVPHVNRHPVGIINKREPLNSDKASGGAYAQTDSSVEAGRQFVDIFHAISQPKPGDKTIYTARMVPNSILARQARMDADLQGRNPVGRLLHPDGRNGADPRLRAPRPDRGGQGGGPSGRRGRNRDGRRGRDRRNNRRRSPDSSKMDKKKTREELDREMDEYWKRRLTEGDEIEEDS